MTEGSAKSLADRLRMARERAGLSQKQVAELLKLHRPSVSEMEAGRRSVSAEELARLSEIYDVDIDWLSSGNVSTGTNAEVELAARQLSKLKKDDLDRVIDLLRTLRKKQGRDK